MTKDDTSGRLIGPGLFGGSGDGESSDSEILPFDDSTISVLQTFGASPVGFIFGVILTPLLSGVETGVLRSLDLVNLVFYGDSRATTDGLVGIADIPAVSASVLISAGDTIGEPILTMAVRPLVDGLLGFADWAGPLGLLGAAIVFVVLVNVFSESIRLLIEIVVDAIPGGGAFLN